MRTITTNFIGIVFVALSMFGPPAIAATGPVSAGSLPGGAVVVDSDNPGTGEAWGRASGRTYSYSGFVTSNFTELTWQAMSAGMSFDGPIDAPGENMLLASQGATTATWAGTTTVNLTTGPTVVNTRFTVTLSGATFTGATPPTVDVLANSNFSVHVLFEAENPNNPGSFVAALDLFDSLDTPPPPAEMLANTSFAQGFFFDEVAEGLSLAEHDANMQGRANEIVGKLDFLTIEEAGHFMQLVGEHQDLEAKLDELLAAGGNEMQLLAIQSAIADNNQKLMDILMVVTGLPDSDQLRSLQDDLTGLIACLWIGFLCPAEVPPGAPNLVALSADLAEILHGIHWVKDDLGMVKEDLEEVIDNLASINAIPAAIDLEVISSKRASGKSRVFLVLSRVSGVATTSTLSVLAAPDTGNGGFSLVPVVSTSVELAPGVQQLTIELQGDLKSTKTFLISAERTLDDNSTQVGSTLTSTNDTSE